VFFIFLLIFLQKLNLSRLQVPEITCDNDDVRMQDSLDKTHSFIVNGSPSSAISEKTEPVNETVLFMRFLKINNYSGNLSGCVASACSKIVINRTHL
jgi:hypothetical protein